MTWKEWRDEKMKDPEIAEAYSQDKMDDRFVTSFERIAAALELIAQKMPWPFTGAVQPFVPQPYQPTIFSSPNTNGVAIPSGATAIPVNAFQDLTEGRPMRVGSGG